MAHPDIYRQLATEKDLLTHIVGALRSVIDWQIDGDDFSEKLSSLQFVILSLQRHLDRLISLERCVEMHYSEDEQEQFRTAVSSLVERLESLSSADKFTLCEICDDLLDVLEELERHVLKLAVV